jgi:hypothetical protein
MPSDLVAQYQQKFDREFPAGAVASWQDTSTTTYLIPRVLVTGQHGLDPEIWLPVFAGSDKTLGPFRVLSIQQVQRVPHMVAVTLDNVESPLLLNAGVSPEVMQAMAADRQRFTELAPAGGARVHDGDAAE